MTGRLVLALVAALSWLPRSFSQALGRVIGYYNYARNTRSARVTRVNLELCFPEMDVDARERLVRDSLENTGMTMMETPAAWFQSRERLLDWIVNVEGESLLSEPLSRGQGVIVLLPHIGNWELINMFCVPYGRQTGLYQPPRQVWLQEMMGYVRSRYGHDLVPTNRQGISRLYKAVRDGGLVVVLPDQVPASGLFVPFFEVPALTDQLTSRMIQKTGAVALAVTIARRDDGRFDITFNPADEAIYSDDLEKSVRAVNSTVENCVLSYPSQYQWEYKRFRERPAGEEKLYQFDKPGGVHD